MSCTTTQGAGGLDIRGAGQFWFKGTNSATLDATLTGGRIGVSGTVASGLTADVYNEAEFVVVQGGAITFGSGDDLIINGDVCRAGFDGQGGSASMTFAGGSTLNFVAGNGGMSTIEEFRSGHYGIEDLGSGVMGQPLNPSVASSVTLESGSTVTVDTTGLSPGTYDLIVVDTLTDNGATLPSGVTVVGGTTLRLTVGP